MRSSRWQKQHIYFVLNAKNEEFAEMLAESIDEMADQRANT